MTQLRLAELLGVDQKTISNIEGGRLLKKPMGLALAQVLEVSHTWLITGQGTMEPQGDEITASERKLIKAWRRMPQGFKRVILELSIKLMELNKSSKGGNR